MKETEVINISGNFVIYSSLLPYLVSDLSHYLTAGLFYSLYSWLTFLLFLNTVGVLCAFLNFFRVLCG